jgi:hypothetical protein
MRIASLPAGATHCDRCHDCFLPVRTAIRFSELGKYTTSNSHYNNINCNNDSRRDIAREGEFSFPISRLQLHFFHISNKAC